MKSVWNIWTGSTCFAIRNAVEFGFLIVLTKLLLPILIIEVKRIRIYINGFSQTIKYQIPQFKYRIGDRGSLSTTRRKTTFISSACCVCSKILNEVLRHIQSMFKRLWCEISQSDWIWKYRTVEIRNWTKDCERKKGVTDFPDWNSKCKKEMH